LHSLVRSRFFIDKDALGEAEPGQIAAMDFVRNVILVVTTRPAPAASTAMT
jgi:hypothetical protein